MGTSDSKLGPIAAGSNPSPLIPINTGFSWKAEFYITCLSLSWARLCLIFIGSCIIETCLFFLLYRIQILGFDNGEELSSFDIFMFSLSISAHGSSPVSARSHLVCLLTNIHGIINDIVVLFFTGVVFTRLAEPITSIKLSDHILFCDFQEQNCLMTRMAISRLPPELVDVRFSLTFKHVKNGFAHLDDLTLVRPYMAHLRYAMYIRHIITPESPLYGYDRRKLLEEDASFRLTIMACEPKTMQSQFATYEYQVSLNHDEVMFDRLFDDTVYTRKEDGARVIDLSLLSKTHPKSPSTSSSWVKLAANVTSSSSSSVSNTSFSSSSPSSSSSSNISTSSSLASTLASNSSTKDEVVEAESDDETSVEDEAVVLGRNLQQGKSKKQKKKKSKEKSM